MLWQISFKVCLFWTLYGLIGCSSAPYDNPKVRSMSILQAVDEPCWVRTPHCRDDINGTAIYFVGQSKVPIANWGSPGRDSYQSAQRDAEHAYARYLGVEVESSSYLQSIFKNEEYRLRFRETIQEKVHHTVSELTKTDDYFVSHRQTSEGEPLWTVYVLLKIEKADVRKHQEAIAQEARQLALAPEPPDQWVATVFNIDDTVDVYVNEKKISQCDFSRTCEIKLNPHFKKGQNKVRFEYRNNILFWTYGYEVSKNGEVMYEGRCGQVWVLGCGFLNTQKGLVHSFEFEVEKSESLDTIDREKLRLAP